MGSSYSVEVPQLTSALISPSYTWPISPTPSLTLATAKKLAAAEQRRKRPSRFSCPLCPQRFTTQRNLESTSCFVLEMCAMTPCDFRPPQFPFWDKSPSLRSLQWGFFDQIFPCSTPEKARVMHSIIRNVLFFPHPPLLPREFWSPKFKVPLYIFSFSLCKKLFISQW